MGNVNIGPGAQRMPDALPIFPLTSALLLPGCRLPLRIFEPRYLQMVDDALAGDRLIGMIQPTASGADEHDPDLQSVGCAGRIASLKEAEGGHYLVSLVGISRFEVIREIPSDRLYRLVEPQWERFTYDIGATAPAEIDREVLVANLRTYFETFGLDANWRAIDDSGDEELVNSLAMVCPFDNTEKQALLEAPNLEHRSRLVIALMNMAVMQGGDSSTVH
jgi:hypothetical protein